MQMYRSHVKSPREDAATCFSCSLKDICFSIDFFHPGPSKCLGCEISNARRHASLTIIRRLGYVLTVPPSLTHLHEPSCEFNKKAKCKLNYSGKSVLCNLEDAFVRTELRCAELCNTDLVMRWSFCSEIALWDCYVVLFCAHTCYEKLQ